VKLARRKIVERKALDGSVTLHVRRPTWAEAQELKATATSADSEKLRELLIAQIERIDGLEIEDVGPITTGAQAFEHLDVDTLGELLKAVSGAGSALGGRSGGILAAALWRREYRPGTAAPVDAAD
jgi:hypothetical protein